MIIIRITEAHCEFLRELIAEDASRTLEFMQEQLMVVDDLWVDVSTIHRRIAGFHFKSNYVAKVNRNCQECMHGRDYCDN